MINRDYVLFKNREFKDFCIYRLIFGISYSFMIPVIPLFLKSMGMETVTIGVVISLYGVSKTLTQIPFGIISDYIGDKLALKLTLFFMTFIPVGYVFADTNFTAGSLYVLQGAVLGMAAPATYSILARTLDSNKRGECTGIAAAVFTFGGGIGAAIAGFIVTKLNSYNMVFYISSFGIFIALLYVIFNVRKIKTVKERSKNNSENKIKKILHEISQNNLGYKIVILASSAFLGDYIYSCVVALFHFYGQEVLGVSTVYTSSIISIYLLVFGMGAPIAGYVSDRIGNRIQFFFSFALMDLTLLGLIITRSIPVFTVTIIMYFLGATFLNSALQSSLSEFGANPRIKGFVFGVVGASESLGYAVGPLISAFIYSSNKNYLFLGLLLVSVLVSSLYILFFNKAKI
ncbi:MFS transporter [Clostridium botulinum]|uniref:MFS transporter n=1 Tax=Clostridium botulinum TaxID=1491 RepID=UPI000363C429|nr:MFS transporter [Clostridium botulinum]MBN1035131.1 MFS transporter [Clostridium botulinum]NFG26939.1 MFS transporter [Clostridium botulinum]